MQENEDVDCLISRLIVKFSELKPNCSLISYNGERLLYSHEAANNEIKIDLNFICQDNGTVYSIDIKVHDLCRDRIILSKNIEYKFNDIDGMAEKIINVGTSVHSVNELRLFVADIVNADLSPHELIGGESKDNSVLLRDYFNEIHEYQVTQAAISRKNKELQDLKNKIAECQKNRDLKITAFFNQLREEFKENKVNCQRLIWHSPVCYFGFNNERTSDVLYSGPSSSKVYVVIAENGMNSRSLSFKVKINSATSNKFAVFDAYCKNAAHLRSIIEDKIQEFESGKN